MRNKQSKIQIADSVIRCPEISPKEFVILLRLKQLYFFNGNQENIDVDITKLKCNLSINDNRTVKKHLNQLHEKGFIKNQITFNRNKPVEIILDIRKLTDKPFTQLPAYIMKKIDDIEHPGIRLLYYYESYVNRNSLKKQFCFASIDTISSDTGMNRKTIFKYNKILDENKLLKIEKHKLGTDYSYDENDELVFDKFHNHYSVLLDHLKP